MRFRYDINNNSPVSIDLSQSNIAKLIETHNPKGEELRLVEKLHCANKSLVAHSYELYEVMIREFYFVLEKDVKDNKFPQGIKYKFLRHALSHPGPLKKYTKQGLRDNFPKDYFDFTDDCTFDRSSSKNLEHVKIEAMELMKIAVNHIQGQLSKQRH
jgi:hypothetical protein